MSAPDRPTREQFAAALHALEYRAGLAGFGRADSAPGWHCSCGGWSLPARATRSGPNRAEAERKHRKHREHAATHSAGGKS